MHDELQELFEAIREEASRASWSRGVELARAGAVTGGAPSAGSLHCSVSAPGERIARNVTLDWEGCDWSCDCDSREGACLHVTASIIASKRAAEEGKALPAATGRSAKVGYRFRRSPTGLQFSRVLIRQGEETPLKTTLGAIVAGRVEGPELQVTEADLEIDGLVGAKVQGWFPKEILARILPKLAGREDVRLDDAPMVVSSRKVGLVAVLVDRGGGFHLSVERDRGIDEVFANGVARCGDTLHLVDEPELTARELEELRQGRLFGQDEVVELVTELLPSLSRRIRTEIRAKHLPKTTRAVPRLMVHTEREGASLSVLPTIVYGDPPTARLVGDRLVHIQGAAPLRDKPAEERLARRLHDLLGTRPGVRIGLRSEEAIAFVAQVRQAGIELSGAGAEAFTLAPPVEPRLDVRSDGFSLTFPVAGAPGREADAGAVLQAWRDGETLVPLLGGGFSPLPLDWLRRFGPVVADLLAAQREDGSLPPAALPDLGRLCEGLDLPPPPGLERLRPLLEGFDGLRPPALPDDLRAELRPYQRDGVAWLSFLRSTGMGALLADDMGLGKTLQTICVLEPGSLVVAPTSVLHNWAAELERFRPGLRVALYHGPGRTLDPAADVVLTSYAILRLDVERLASRSWQVVVLDEAQAIKNPESQVAQAAFRLRGDFRICLSGTPVENRLDELWSQLHFLNPGLLGGRTDFRDRYAQPLADGRPGVAERLRGRIRPFVLRRLKRDVAKELPPRTDLVLRFPLEEEERRVYDAILAATRKEVVERLGAGGNVMEALEALLRLRQAACHVGLVPGQEAARSSKVDLLLERLTQAVEDGHKALVFSQWTGLLDKVEPHLEAAGVEFLRLDGSTRDRGGVVRAFQDEGGPPVLLASLKAGGTGLNLTAADHVFLLDPWWNPAAEDQAADRAHRIGQERPVMVHRLVAEETVEERILELQARKRSLADAALGDAQAAASLTREDLAFLFS